MKCFGRNGYIGVDDKKNKDSIFTVKKFPNIKTVISGANHTFILLGKFFIILKFILFFYFIYFLIIKIMETFL